MTLRGRGITIASSHLERNGETGHSISGLTLPAGIAKLSAASKRLKPKSTPKTIRKEVVEFTSAPVGKVDREAAIIYGVKLSGLDSRNGRRYAANAYRNAIPLYEGRTAYCNHPIDPSSGKPKPGRVRVIEDALGVWKNIQMRPDGPYGDLHYLKSHPMAERVCEVAERMPNLFGCSHNALGEGEHRNGVFEISSIPEVRSVDIVCDPGTTNGMFESRNPMKTWKEVVESLAVHPTKKAKLVKLMEDDYMSPDMPAEEPEGASPEDALKQGFWSAIEAVWNDDSMDVAAKVKKIGELIKTHGRLTETPAEEPAPEADETPAEDDKKTPEQTIRTLKAELNARSLCEQHDVKPMPKLVQALAALPEADREAFLLENKAMSKVKSPVSRGPGFTKNEVTEQTKPVDVKSFVASIRE